MPTYVIKSTDPGVPVLNIVNGSLINVLDYCLVNVGGWSKEFSGTNKAVYRPPNGNRLFLRVDDNQTNFSIVRAYANMTSVDSGTGVFPTSTQMADSRWYKQNNTKPWMAVVNDRGAYLSLGNNVYTGLVYYFGDFISFKTGDTMSTFINISPVHSSDSQSFNTLYHSSVNTFPGYMFAAGSYTSTIPNSTPVGLTGNSHVATHNEQFGVLGYPYPVPATGSMVVNPILIHEPNAIRGRMPGLWQICHAQSNFTEWQTFNGTGDLSGRTFIIQKTMVSSSIQGCIAIEISDTWWT